MSPKDRAGAEGREPEVGREEAEARPEAEGLADADLAAAGQALAQARAAARAKGLRPGKVGKRRVRDVPVDARRDSGRDPQLIGDEVSAFVSARGWQVDVAVGAVLGRWASIVGPEVASHCTPEGFEAGILTLRADSTAWATQLRMLASSLAARVNLEVGEGTVVEVRVLGPSAPSWRHGGLRSPDSRGPRDTYG